MKKNHGDISERDCLSLVYRALHFARKKFGVDITAQRLSILIAVYLHPGLSQRELLDKLDSTSITALSRNLADLSDWTTRKTPGPGIVELRADPMNLRVKRVRLTRRGRRLVSQWVKTTQAVPAPEDSA